MLLKGKPVADKIKEDIRNTISKIEASPAPKLAILRVGERGDDIAYENMLIKNCGDVGMGVEVKQVSDTIDTNGLIAALEGLNNNHEISGILMFRPLPKHIDEKAVSAAIDPEKDVDCMHPMSMAKVFIGEKEMMPPSTPVAVMELIKHYYPDITGKHAVIVNRSVVLGKALAMLFLNENATVTLSHSKTKDMKELTSGADIVVSGIGKARFFDESYFSKKSIVADVGINFDEAGKMCGDVDSSVVEAKAEAISPVPGGVGSITSAVLLKHVLNCYQRLQNN